MNDKLYNLQNLQKKKIDKDVSLIFRLTLSVRSSFARSCCVPMLTVVRYRLVKREKKTEKMGDFFYKDRRSDNIDFGIEV